MATISEAIGPWQIFENTLWFAKTFPDGEGYTGLGGFGYFDIAARRYHLYTPHELADWSVSAMLVEPAAVWLALAYNGEYGTRPGGLLRFDRATETVERLPLPDLVNTIARIGDHLLLATNFGAALVKGHSVRRFFVDYTSDRRLQMSEAILTTAQTETHLPGSPYHSPAP